MARRDLTGEVFATLTAVEVTKGPRAVTKGEFWLCKCTCGNSVIAYRYDLLRGRADNMCSCSENYVEYHGMSKTTEFKIWDGMKQRCHNPNDPGYKNYGARGIFVCPEWRKSFLAFYKHVGPRPSKGHSIDRMDNDKGYEPGNVKWATLVEQHSNTRRNRFLTHNGVTLTMAEHARRAGLTTSHVAGRLRNGWSVAEALGPRLYTRK